ncbi:HD superfamily phosphohydrolase [Halalkaliarchaeum sp. AArc-CO]|uniref:HD domain-containing protein n=1 Tax=Halalkaliarchaeum sp. AArc-CO TaxID=2866381 RepID=UPI00217E48C5|nr:HD domain-containing protein [Halalkaliarchaeum sp. AArc-CO]UWG50305.1 HD superfamily phosphohydrolase [Halalkaliarchaeum sp. AArc-CO]
MATIKDSVHDHIEVTGPPEALLDTPAVQRLRRIRQLGTAQFVYPSANHTRFEHSLGVYHLASRAAERLDLPERDVAHVEAAALLHDVGHGPFSHNIEALTHRRTGKYHDEVEELIASGRVGETLREHDLDPERVAQLIRGEGTYGQLVSGELDVDRMDYLVRDAHHTGVPYGTIDHERLTRELTFVDGELVLDEGNVQTAESLLLARALMNPTVYKHHVARISKAMLRRASERLLDSESGAAVDVDAERLRRMDDHDLIVALRSTPETERFSRRFDARRLLKRSVWAEWSDVPEWILDADHREIRRIERQIAEEADVDSTDVIVDVPSEPSITESSSRVLVNGEMRRLDGQSPLVSALRTAQKGQWRLGVYTREELTDRVGRIAAEKLDIDAEGGLVTDVRTKVYHTLDEFER